MKFSVLMSVYKNETPQNLIASLDSVLCQTRLPDQIILVRDGPVGQPLQEVIDRYIEDPRFTYVPTEVNQGLGNALNTGLSYAEHAVVARMDTDDICLPDRFEKQIAFMEKHSEIDVCGGQILEFFEDINTPIGKREVPCTHGEICSFLKRRNPFNHMTVMFRKDAVTAAGSYRDLYLAEDYYLWCRMLLHGARFANLNDILVYARTGETMYRRRGGYRYFKTWKELETFKMQQGITNRLTCVMTLCSRFFVQVMIPNRLRGWILKTFSRTHSAKA